MKKKNTVRIAKPSFLHNFSNLILNNWEIKLFSIVITFILWALAHFR